MLRPSFVHSGRCLETDPREEAGKEQHREENGRQGKEKGERSEGEGKAEERSGPGSPPSLPRLRGDPRARGLASPPKPARAPAPPPLTGCRRPRSARRARCWGAAGSGTLSAALGKTEGRKGGKEGGREGASAARARRERLRRPWGSCTARPRAASRETSRGGLPARAERGAKILPRFGSAHARGPRGGAPGTSGARRACPVPPPRWRPRGLAFPAETEGRGSARAKMAAVLPP